MYGIENINFGAIDFHSRNGSRMPPSLEQEAQEAIRLAKLGTGAIIGLQAIAAIAAFGMLMIQWKTYCKNQKNRSKTKSRRAR